MFTLLALLAQPVLADDGFWHPNDLMTESTAFAKLNEGTLGPFDERTRRTQELAHALNNYALAIDLLGERATDDQRTRLDAMEKQFNREKATLEAFAQALIEDVDQTFYGAVERALGTMGGEHQMCEREIVTGPQVPGMRSRTSKNPECSGTDLNGALASAIDSDAQLAADVEEILGLEWPSFTLEASAQPAVGGTGSTWVAVRPLFTKGAKKALEAIDFADDQARLPLQSAIEEGADTDALAKLKKQAEEIDAATARSRSELAAPVLAAADKSLTKWGESTGWCANPATLGGCEGENRTSELVPKLLDDARVEKSLKKAASAAGG